MPTAKYFSSIPPFPDDLPTLGLPRLSLAKLIANDRRESEELFRGCRTDGFLQLDMNGSPEGDELLAEAETLMEINREVNGLSLDEKVKFAFQPPESLIGYEPHGTSLNTLSPYYMSIFFFLCRHPSIIACLFRSKRLT